ncbi:unnamed protein product [Schistosoma turkestanicum]|nr:unnamed protein product [Schistosoma turkestanicum]
MHSDLNNSNTVLQSNTANLTSSLVRERLKNCVLNKRKSKEQGINSNDTTTLLNIGVNQQHTTHITTDKDFAQLTKNIDQHHEQSITNSYVVNDDLTGKPTTRHHPSCNHDTTDSSNDITPLTIDIENHQSSLVNQPSSVTSLPTISSSKKSNTSHQIQHSLSNHETETNYMDFENDVHTHTVMETSLCDNFMTQHDLTTIDHHQHQHQHPQQYQQPPHKLIDENLRKTVSEPSLKMRTGSGGVQKSRYKQPERRHHHHHHHVVHHQQHFGMNTAAAAAVAAAAAAAAAAAMNVSSDPLSIVGLWPQLSSAFQHANLIQKSINKKPLKQLQDLNHTTTTTHSSNLSSIDSDDQLSKSEKKSIIPLSKTFHDIILTELIKTNELINDQELLEKNNNTNTNTNNDNLNSRALNSFENTNHILNDCMLFGSTINGLFCTSLPNLTTTTTTTPYHSTSSLSLLQRNSNTTNNNNSTNLNINQTNNSTIQTNHSTSLIIESNNNNNNNGTNTSTETNSTFNQSVQLNKSFPSQHHQHPHPHYYYYRNQSMGLISRTKSAPLSLATGYNTTNYRQIPWYNNNSNNSLNNVQSLSTAALNNNTTPTSVTSAANILAMKAATNNFQHQQSQPQSQSQQNCTLNLVNQSTVKCTSNNNNISSSSSNNLQSSVDNELSSRDKVVLQLRKKILERSEFLTSDRSCINIMDSANTPMSRINQTTKRGNPLLERTASSPVVSMAPTLRSETVPETTFTTVLAYDLGMLAHHCTCQTDANHPENPQRLISIWQRLQQTGLAAQCHHQPGRRASLIELQLVHKDVYTVLFGSNPASRCRIDPTLLATVRLCRLACGGVGVDSDTAWHTAGHTAHAARLAAGCVIDLACRVMLGQCPNGFALVRPPGHHAEPGQAMGFCYFNSVAIAAKRAQFLGSTGLSTEQSSVMSSLTNTLFDQSTFLPYTMESTMKPRILIVDWDIHHGNGTQTMFYTDPSVLYISLHRHDEGGFFPGTGSPEEIGSGAGEGYTINIAWPSGIIMSDAEYLAAFRLIILPVACEFQPSLILISAGFDAAPGHSANLGGYSVSPAAFGWMTRLLSMEHIANSKVVLSLEGGYDMNSLCDCIEACVRALLQSAAEINEKNAIPINNVPNLIPIKQSELDRAPHPLAIQTLLKVAHLHSTYWNSFSKEIDTQYASIPASRWLPTLFDNSIEIKDFIHSATTTTTTTHHEHTSTTASTNISTLNANKRYLKQTSLTTTTGELNVLPTSVNNNTTESNRYSNFVMRQASSMDETIETEMKPNFARRRSATGITASSNMDSLLAVGGGSGVDTNETITRIALTRLAELHVTTTQQPE